MEAPKEPQVEVASIEVTPKREYTPRQRAVTKVEPVRHNRFLTVAPVMILGFVCVLLFCYMGYQIKEESLLHTAYEIATSTAEQVVLESKPEFYQRTAPEKAAQIAIEKQKEKSFVLKSVEVIEQGNSKLLTVSLEGRYLFNTIQVSWRIRL